MAICDGCCKESEIVKKLPDGVGFCRLCREQDDRDAWDPGALHLREAPHGPTPRALLVRSVVIVALTAAFCYLVRHILGGG